MLEIDEVTFEYNYQKDNQGTMTFLDTFKSTIKVP